MAKLKMISVKVVNSCIDSSIKHHKKPETQKLVTKEFSKGFISGMKFVKKYIVNAKVLQDEE